VFGVGGETPARAKDGQWQPENRNLLCKPIGSLKRVGSLKR